MTAPRHHRVGIVGAGIAGIGMSKRLLDAGITDFTIWERNGSVGGTWFEHTYPGCACDIPTHLYSYGFQRNPNWTRLFPRQEEILDYVRDTAQRFGITEKIYFDCEMFKSTWDERTSRWRVKTSEGVFTCDVLVSAIGATAEPDEPDIPGLEDFKGHRFHSARWDHDHDLTGERVAVIGTGRSSRSSTGSRFSSALHRGSSRIPTDPFRGRNASSTSSCRSPRTSSATCSSRSTRRRASGSAGRTG
jgi:cation diffusion facilitator CzcD-associated flavoprotein CzcO